MHKWNLRHVSPVIFNHGLPRPVGLAGRSAELLGCAAGAAVLGIGVLSVESKRRPAARFREAVSWRAARRSAIIAAHRVALALGYRGLVRSFGVLFRIRTSGPEAVFECLVATLTGHFLPTSFYSSVPPYLTMLFVEDFDWPAPGGGMARAQKPVVFNLAKDYACSFVADAFVTACFGCHALRAPRVSWLHAALLLANIIASLAASWSAASLEMALETTKTVPVVDEA